MEFNNSDLKTTAADADAGVSSSPYNVGTPGIAVSQAVGQGSRAVGCLRNHYHVRVFGDLRGDSDGMRDRDRDRDMRM